MRRALLCFALGALPGCGPILGLGDFHTEGDAADAALPSDTSIVDALDGTTCYGSFAPVCFTSELTTTITLEQPIDTATDTRCRVETQVGGPDRCVIAADKITVKDVVVTGTRVLVLVGNSIDVMGDLDVSSKFNGAIGAGANFAGCPAGQAAGANGGGAAGGSFQGVGGDGGKGSNSSSTGAKAGAVQTPTVVRGGCPGTVGTASQGGTLGTPGPSGGAVDLIARDSISIEGAVYASGAGGGGTRQASGGGGGSGGLIVLEAPTITVTGTIAANGGGGGADGDAKLGTEGADGTTANYNMPAAGGDNMGDSHGGDGGAGGCLGMAAKPGQTASQAGAGAGGGGGVGWVIVHGSLAGLKISPDPTTI